jgi:hypothetical protein
LIKTSKVEGFFGPPLEMMSCGGVSLVFKVTGYDEYIVHEENALVANAGDVEGAAKLLSDLINDKEKFERLKLNGKETVKFWTWDRSIDYLEMYIKDISNKKIVESNIINNTLNYSYYNLLGNNTLNITIDNTVDVHIYEALKKKPFILKVIRKMFIYMKNVRNFLR